jgi:hypothetical protein
MIEELLDENKEKRGRDFRITDRSKPKMNTTVKVKPNAEIMESFFNTSVQHVALREKRESKVKGVIKASTGKQRIKEMMEGKEDLRDGFQSEQEKLNKLKEEVKALPDILKPNPHPRTYNMLLTQKKCRRTQHIEELQDFERQVAGVKNRAEQNTESLKRDVEGYLQSVGAAIEQFVGGMADGVLAGREIDLVGQVRAFGEENAGNLQGKLAKVDTQLDQFEDGFYNDIQGIVDNLKLVLVDIAFKLEPEIDGIISDIRGSFKHDVECFYADRREQVAQQGLLRGVAETGGRDAEEDG